MIEQSKKGYLTLAFGKNFAEMAVDMALSIKQFDSKPVSCVVDSKTKNYINKNYEFVFDRLIEIDDNKFCFSIKFIINHTISNIFINKKPEYLSAR